MIAYSASGSCCIILDGQHINTLEDAYVWLRSAWEDEPYNMWYETVGVYGNDNFREAIFIEPIRGNEGAESYQICSLAEFREFISNH